MNKFFLLILMFGFVACSSSNDDQPATDAEIAITPSELNFSYDAESQTVTVESNADWSVYADQDWCKTSQSGGLTGSTTLTVSVTANYTEEERVANLIFRSGRYTQEIKVTQEYEVKVISIPDAAFKAYCVENFDTDGDGEISTKEVLAITDVQVASKNISSLSGIESFVSLVTLDCSNNKIATIDVSNLKALKQLNCSSNLLSVLDIRTNINLESLDCRGNESLTEILVWTGFTPSDSFLKPDVAEYVEPEIPTPPGYTLVWQEEFNAPRLADGRPALVDESEWWYEVEAPGWVNNELQRYVAGFMGTDTCAVVTDGTLKIIAQKYGSEVISARINTSRSWTYGYFEARLNLPTGRGTWPAFWMMPANYTAWPDDGEIDIMEEVGADPNMVSSSIHCKAYYHSIGTQKTAERYVAGAEGEFHIYALEWTADYIQTYVDGEPLFRFENDKQGNKDTWPFDDPFYLKLNLAWGGDWGGYKGVDESALPVTYEIDYVRVFQK